MNNYKNYKRTIFSWSIYDFANQPFTTITITFIYSVFFANNIFIGTEEAGVVAWGRAITISSIVIALLSPIMGAIADRGGYRKLFLIFWTWVCIIFSFCLYYPLEGDVFNALLFVCVANIGFEMGGVFLNAYLPEIAPRHKIGRISGYGWSFGYVGGLIALGLCYVLFVSPGVSDGCDLPSNNLYLLDGDVLYNSSADIAGFQFNIDETAVTSASGGDAEDAGFSVLTDNNTVLGLSFTESFIPAGCGTLTSLEVDAEVTGLSAIVIYDLAGNVLDYVNYDDGPINPFTGRELIVSSDEHIRIINIFIAIWFAIFSIPTFLYVKGKKHIKKSSKNLISDSFKTIKKTFNDIKKYKQITRFLIARIIYNDAIITLIIFGGPYASNQFGFNLENGKLMIFGIVLNVFAGIGAFLLGFLDDYIGGKRTIQITNIGFIVALIIAFVAPSLKSGEFYFWISGALIGIFMGPNQAASRSLMGRLIPKNKENEFYGFFAFSGKATAFLGPFLFTLIIAYTGNMRWAILMLAALFLFGVFLLNRVNTEEGIKIAEKN